MERRKKKNNKGITLVELIITIAIAAELAAVIAPSVIRYIDKARRAVDLQTAQVIYEAAYLSAATSNDDVIEGWDVIGQKKYERQFSGAGAFCATADGHRSKKWLNQISGNKSSYYELRLVAWARGIRYDYGSYQWDNSYFKACLNGGEGTDAAKQRVYTDEFLQNLYHGNAVGGSEGLPGKRNYSGENIDLTAIKYIKISTPISKDPNLDLNTYTQAKKNVYPHCETWMLYRRDDTGTPEIWIGWKPSGSSVTPLYRLYPNTCAEYQR